MPTGRLVSMAVGITRIAIFDIAGPLVTYNMLRSAGESDVTSLIVSGAFPALNVVGGTRPDG
jgi:hypothetical protein